MILATGSTLGANLLVAIGSTLVAIGSTLVAIGSTLVAIGSILDKQVSCWTGKTIGLGCATVIPAD